MSLFEVLYIKHCHVLDHVLFHAAAHSHVTGTEFVDDYFHYQLISCCRRDKEFTPSDFGKFKIVGWACEWQRVTWLLEIDKKMPRANQSDNTRFISVNSDRSPSLTNLWPCLISSCTHTYIIHTHLHKGINAFFKVLTYYKCLCILLSYLRAFPCHQRS